MHKTALFQMCFLGPKKSLLIIINTNKAQQYITKQNKQDIFKG